MSSFNISRSCKCITGILITFLLVFVSCSVKDKTISLQFGGTSHEKSWALKELNPNLPSDWSGSRFLTFEFNSSTTHRFEINLHDKSGIRQLEILPFQGVWVRASIPLVHFQKMNTDGMDQASIWKRPGPGYWIGFTGAVGPINSVDSLSIAMDEPVGSPVLEIRNVRLTSSAQDSIFTSKPLVDEFGQWIPDEWPGKAKSIDELHNDWSAEEKSLEAGNEGVSKYGGFREARAKATGFFHVEKADGRWWFIDPDGCLFFSNGSCCIQPGSDLARVGYRRYIFSSLPPDAEEQFNDKPQRGTSIRSFYTWNLSRRFGQEWYQKWIDLTAKRMTSWGLNTIGNWSDPNLGASHRKAYVSTLEGWGIEEGKMGMPDVYAPDYNTRVESAAEKQCSKLKDDPFLLGYFIGNEPPWPGRESELAQVILDGQDTPMKEALKKYLAPGDTPERRKAFAYETFSKFLTTVCSAVKKYDPNHLNLGLRFGDPPAKEIIIESGKHFDVFSMNHYGYSVSNDVINKIYELARLPLIIGEFHFGIPGRGLAPGLAQVKNPEERAAAYRYYVENAAANPEVIGTHWFQWIDQPCTGRFDGENYNIGFVDVTDKPYPEMIQAARETFGRLEAIHAGKEVPVTRKAVTQ